MRIELEGGKYTYVLDEAGKQEALRYGEPWRDLVGDKFVYCMAAEIESLRAQLATANAEVARLNEWADGFTDTHLRERKTGDELIKELRAQLANEKSAATEIYQALENSRAQLAEERQQKHEALHREYCRREELNAQLLATQARAARMKEALETCKARTIMGGGPMCEVSFYFDEAKVQKALSTPINLDALHEDRARECERLAGKCDEEASEYGTDTDGWHGARSCAELMREEADAHRAKKES